MKKIKQFLRKFGPGVIAGAADDDPSGIATYSQTGAQFGYAQLWTALYMLPLLIAIQEASARIGAVTGKGITAAIKTHYSKKILYAVVFLVTIANIINIGADLGAMADAACLIVPANPMILIALFAGSSLLLEIKVSYKRYAKFLKWLCLFLLAYPLTLFIISAPWKTILTATFFPQIQFNFEFFFIITGVVGTTISPYLFFWEASEEVEEVKSKRLLDKERKPRISKYFMRRLRFDNMAGMFFSEFATWSIIVVAASVLNANGVTDIATASDAAKALEPLVKTFPHAGFIAKLIFAIGIVGLGFLSVPILAGAAAYALSELFSWRASINLQYKNAKGFYWIIILATLLGALLTFFHIDPFKALVYAAVINGVTAVPLILIIILISRNEEIMGKYKNGKLSSLFLWITFIGVAMAASAMLFSFF